MKIQILPQSKITITAKSTLHNVQGTCIGLAGEIDYQDKRYVGTISCALTLPLKNFSSGSSLPDKARNFAMHKHLETDKHPYAYCQKLELLGTTEDTKEILWRAVVSYKDREVTVNGNAVENERGEFFTNFVLNIKELGIKPPSFLFLQVEENITVAVTLYTRESI